MKTRSRVKLRLAAACVLTAVLGAAQAEAQAEKWGIRKKGEQEQWQYVQDIGYRSDGDVYRVVKDQLTVYNVARSEVAELKIPEPAGYGAFAAQLPADAAIKGIESIVSQYQCRNWDVEGLRLLIPVYINRNENKKAVGACEKIRTVLGAMPEDLLAPYWTALLNDGQKDRVLNEVNLTIQSGTRLAAAAAHMLRGDIYRKDGKLHEALRDGYFRVLIVFEDVKALQAQALFSTWETLKALRDARAEKFRAKLLEEYPKSEYAAKVSE